MFFNESNTGGMRRRGRRPGEHLSGVLYCFIKEINTGIRRKEREEARRGCESCGGMGAEDRLAAKRKGLGREGGREEGICEKV